METDEVGGLIVLRGCVEKYAAEAVHLRRALRAVRMLSACDEESCDCKSKSETSSQMQVLLNFLGHYQANFSRQEPHLLNIKQVVGLKFFTIDK